MKSLFVGNLAWNVREEDLRTMFEQYGEVASVKIVLDRETGRSRGFGFVEMENAEQALSALNGADFAGRPMRINEARERQPFQERPRFPRRQERW